MKKIKDEQIFVSQECGYYKVKLKQHCCQCGQQMMETGNRYVCFSASCPNYSLLQAGEDFMIKLCEDK